MPQDIQNFLSVLPGASGWLIAIILVFGMIAKQYLLSTEAKTVKELDQHPRIIDSLMLRIQTLESSYKELSDRHLVYVTRVAELETEIMNIRGDVKQLEAGSAIAIIVASASGEILEANNGVRVLFGYQPTEIIGGQIDMLVPLALRDQHHAGFDRVAKEYRPPDKSMLHTSALHKNGQQIPVGVKLGHIGEGPDIKYTAEIRLKI